MRFVLAAARHREGGRTRGEVARLTRERIAATTLLGVAARRKHRLTFRDTGCARGWVGLACEAGYTVVFKDLERAEQLHRFGVSDELAGCHTTQIDGYLIEGHAPLDVVARLLRERPKTRGIGIPGMPSGIAGMGGLRPSPTTIVTLDAPSRAFARVNG